MAPNPYGRPAKTWYERWLVATLGEDNAGALRMTLRQRQ